MPWSAVKRRLVSERKQLAGLLLKELEENLAALAEGRLLGTKQHEEAEGSDRLQLFGEDLQDQLRRAYDRVDTVNDALVKYQRFRSGGAGRDDYEKKTAEFQQFIAWQREGLSTALQNLRARLSEVLREPEESEPMPRDDGDDAGGGERKGGGGKGPEG